jgi:cysteine desulfurase
VDRIYLDHNATTPVDPRVLEAMLPALREGFGNASSLHWFGQQARAALDDARAEIARLIGANPAEVVFTSSGTEADNLALRGAAGIARPPRRGIVYSAIEHHAVMNTAKSLAEEGWPVASVRATADGTVDLDDLAAKVDETTALVAVMFANNETGVIQPVKDVVTLAHARGALVHCDAVQAAGKVPIDVRALDVDLLALSGHKIYAPKGVGVLYVKRGTRLRPWVRGGSQERNRRAGTENIPGIVGMGRAAAIAREELAVESRTPGRAARPAGGAPARHPGHAAQRQRSRVANTTNVSFDGIEAESLLMALDLAGVAVSTGAACAAGAVEPSHVLRAMGIPTERVQGSVRFSLGRATKEADVDRAADVVSIAAAKQRALAVAIR